MMLRVSFTCVLINLLVVSCFASPYSKQYYLTTKDAENPENRLPKNITPDPNPTIRINYTDDYEPHLRMRRNVVDDIGIINKTNSDIMLVVNEIITKNKNNVITALDKFINKSKIQSIGLNISKLICTAEQYVCAGVFKESLKNWVTSIIIGRKIMLSNIQIEELPNINGTLSDKISISNLKITNIVINGIENIIISKYDMDLCDMSTEVELKVPNLHITGLYKLNGTIDDDPIIGDGNLRVDIDELYFYDRSFLISCNENSDLCKSRQKNKTSIANTEDIKVNMTGIKYKDFDELKINEEINKYIKERMKNANSLKISNNMTDVLIQDRPPIDLPYFQRLKNDIIEFSIPYKKLPRCLFQPHPHKIKETMYNFFMWD